MFINKNCFHYLAIASLNICPDIISNSIA